MNDPEFRMDFRDWQRASEQRARSPEVNFGLANWLTTALPGVYFTLTWYEHTGELVAVDTNSSYRYRRFALFGQFHSEALVKKIVRPHLTAQEGEHGNLDALWLDCQAQPQALPKTINGWLLVTPTDDQIREMRYKRDAEQVRNTELPRGVAVKRASHKWGVRVDLNETQEAWLGHHFLIVMPRAGQGVEKCIS